MIEESAKLYATMVWQAINSDFWVLENPEILVLRCCKNPVHE